MAKPKRKTKKTTQVYNPLIKRWVKRNGDNGQFEDVKNDTTPFKDVDKE